MCGSSFRLNLGYHGTELLVRDFCFYIQLTGLILFQVSLTCNFGGQPECCESCAAERSPSTLEKQDIFQAFVWPVESHAMILPMEDLCRHGESNGEYARSWWFSVVDAPGWQNGRIESRK
jgi:hypothetical protein